MSLAVYCPAVKRPRSNVPWSNETVVIGDPIENTLGLLRMFVIEEYIYIKLKNDQLRQKVYLILRVDHNGATLVQNSNLNFFKHYSVIVLNKTIIAIE